MLSICVTIKNRSRVTVDDHELILFPHCVQSIVESVTPEAAAELVVTDWDSDDWPLRDWLEAAAAPIAVNIVPMKGNFSRGAGRNRAARAAVGDILFFLDADCLISRNLLEDNLPHARRGKACFPVSYSFNDPGHQTGWWKHFSYGICMMKRALWERAGGWPEYGSWGKEDDRFFERVSALAEVVREETRGFYHQWHPHDLEWKDRFAVRTPAELRELEQIKLAKRELSALLPSTTLSILVDDARFGLDPLPGMSLLPFLEKDGDYWGAPPDDATAIVELERLRSRGAGFIAFVWTSFWWLEYYTGFREYLRSRFRCALGNERLIVFDLQHSLE